MRVGPTTSPPVDHLDRHAGAGEADRHPERDAAAPRSPARRTHHLGPPTVIVDHQTDEVDASEPVPHRRTQPAARFPDRARIAGKHAHRHIVGTPS